MTKKRVQVRQSRKQLREMRPKTPGAAASGVAPGATGTGSGKAAGSTSQPQQTRRQRERYVESGGLLQGYSPEQVLKLGYIAAAAALVCILIGLELAIGPFGPSGRFTRIIAGVAWLVPVVFGLSFIAPGVRLALRDRKADLRVVQGQLLGASSVSTSLGLGMLMIKTRAGTEQLLCPAGKLSKVPGNVVNVVASVTPYLKHVRSVSIMGQRLAPRPEPPVPPALERLRLLPILTPAVLAAAAILGDDIPAFVPMRPDWGHALVALFGAALLGGGAFYLSTLYQKRLMAEVQGLVPQ